MQPHVYSDATRYDKHADATDDDPDDAMVYKRAAGGRCSSNKTAQSCNATLRERAVATTW
jgi:hypothetical protein